MLVFRFFQRLVSTSNLTLDTFPNQGIHKMTLVRPQTGSQWTVRFLIRLDIRLTFMSPHVSRLKLYTHAKTNE